MALIHGQDTLPKLFRHVVRERGDAVAMREKHLGIWRAITWREYGARARAVGSGLVVLGLRPRDVVSIIAENGPFLAPSILPPAMRPAPRFGEHTRAVMASVLGLDDAELTRLLELGVLEE